MRNSIKFIVLGFCLAFFFAGCALLEPKTAADGTVTTTLTDAMKNIGAGAESVGIFFPAAAAVGGLLSLVANGILGFVTRKKTKQANSLTAALESVTAGVNEFSKNYNELRDKLKDAAVKFGKPEVADEINAIFEKGGNIKTIVQAIANNKNIEAFLKLFIKTAEAKGTA